jgi:ADP-ribosylglycohydrolase
MQRNLILILCISLARLGYSIESTAPTLNKPVVMSRADYEDRVNAIWHGQMLAVFLTLPFEHKTAAVEDIDDFPKPYTSAWVDDDWYYELAALRAFETHGLRLTVKQLGDQWLENNCGSYGSSAFALKNLQARISAPDCGHPRFNRVWWTIGPLFTSEIYGAISPGMPIEAGRMAREYGHINGYAEAVDAAVFNAATVSLGFIEKDPKVIVRRAAEMLDPSSPYRQCVEMVIHGADGGKSFKEITFAIEDRWHMEYPATNNAVANGGLAAAALWFGEGDFWKTIQLASRSGDFVDADNSAAGAIAVIGAMHGMKALPEKLVSQLNDRLIGSEMGKVKLTPAVDEKISDIARRTAKIGSLVVASQGGKVGHETLTITPQAPQPQLAERFELSDLMQYWNPEWELERAGFGGDNLGAMPGIRGITYLDGDTLVTFPRDEVRALRIIRTLQLGAQPRLSFRVGVDPHRTWELLVYVGNKQIHRQIMTGEAAGRTWSDVALDLSEYANKNVTIRLYQKTLFLKQPYLPGNAYWQKIALE